MLVSVWATCGIIRIFSSSVSSLATEALRDSTTKSKLPLSEWMSVT